MTGAELPPFVWFFLGALLLPLLPRPARSWAFLAPPALALGTLAGLEEGTRLAVPFLQWELVPLRVDRLSLLFGQVFSIVAFVGGVYALHLRDTGQQVAALLYAGAALGAVFAGDLFTLFAFWEVMAVASAYLIWARCTPASWNAGMRYIYVHLLGGSLLLGGILLRLGETGSLAFDAFETASFATWLILLGFAVNAAIPPLHAWLADAYPEATVTGAVFLSAFTTKTAVYTLARGFEGWEILVPAGVAMALYGVAYAMMVDDIRRLLAYHIVSQVGYMVAGVGLGSELGTNGATAHAFTHILYKGLLFMGAGAVLHATGRSRLSELGGLAKAMPGVLVLYMVAAFSISGVPLFSGFVSKGVTIAAADALHRDAVAFLLHLASVGTFLSVGLKLPYLTWGGAPQGIEVRPLPWNMFAGMGLAAAANLYLGLAPGTLYALLPNAMEYQPYTGAHLVEALQLLSFTFLATWLLRQRLKGKPGIALDTDWVYRRPARAAYRLGPALVAHAFGRVERGVEGLVQATVRVGLDPVGWVRGRVGEPGAGTGTASTRFRLTTSAMVVFSLICLLVLIGLAAGA